MKITHYSFKELSLEGAGFKNPRTTVDNREIAELAESIAADGLLTPLRVWTPKEDPGLHIVIAGSRRMRAIEKLIHDRRDHGLKGAIPCVDVDPGVTSEFDSLTLTRLEALVDNLQRKNLTTYETAVEMRSLRDGGMKGKDIAKRLAKSQAWVSRHLSSLESASPSLEAAWKAQKLPDDDVQNLAKLKAKDESGKIVPDHAEQDRRLDKLLEHRAAAAKNPKESKAQLKAAREVAKGPTPPKKNARPDDKLVHQFVETLAKVPKAERYLQGLRDGLRFAIGDLGAGEFGKEFAQYAAKSGMLETNRPQKPEPAPKASLFAQDSKEGPRAAKAPVVPLGTVGREKAEKQGSPYRGAKGLWWVDYSNGMKLGYSSRAKARKSAPTDEIGDNGREA